MEEEIKYEKKSIEKRDEKQHFNFPFILYIQKKGEKTRGKNVFFYQTDRLVVVVVLVIVVVVVVEIVVIVIVIEVVVVVI